MLQQLGRYHHVAHSHVRSDASGHARQDDRPNMEMADQRHRGCRRSHLADATLNQDDSLTLQLTNPELAASNPMQELVLCRCQ